MDKKNIYKAIANFQQEMPVVGKDIEGYGYKYSDLPTIVKEINPILKKYGLGFVQPLCGTKLKTIIFHPESGETIESEVDLPVETLVYEENDKKKSVLKGFEGMNRAQAIGAMITYFRRYSLSSILGIITDKDPDASTKVVVSDDELGF